MSSLGTEPRGGSHRARAPGAPVGAISRRRLLDRLGGPERVVLVVAPPGYGKTEVARQWIDTVGVPVGWLAVDLLDDAPRPFWAHVIATVRHALPGVDGEPELLLHERGPDDPVFVDALADQIERAGQSGVLVVDDVWRVRNASVFEGLAMLIERVGHLLRFVIISRTDPPLPTAAWRSRGWVGEVREDDLRFADAEAIEAAAALHQIESFDQELSDQAVVALNARADGWPIGLHLALLAVARERDPEARANALARTDRLLVDYLVSEVLERLSPSDRELVLGLSVLTWFDPELCAELLGPDAVVAVADLRRRHLFLTTLDGPTGSARFHPLFRGLLEAELQWRDPERRRRLHRRAAQLCAARGDLAAAYGHLVAIGDVAAAAELVVPLALGLVDQGDIETLTRHMRSLPAAMQADTADQAFDLTWAWFFAGDEAQATRWCARAQELSDPTVPEQAARAHATWAAIALMQGSPEAATHVGDFVRALDGAEPDGPIERRFATVAARVALVHRRFDEAAVWVQRAQSLREPPAVTSVIAPMLTGWLELETGDLRRARTLADGARREADRMGMRPHHGALDALIVAAQCRLAAGELADAEEILELARSDAAELGWALPIVRAGVAGAEVARLSGEPQRALAALEELRDALGVRAGVVDATLSAVEAAVRIDTGQYRSAQACLSRVPDGPGARLLTARLVTASRADEPVADLLADRAGWTVAERLQAAALLAACEPSSGREAELVEALKTGHETGWVAPFLALGPAVDRAFVRLPIADLHPALAAASSPRRGAREPSGRAQLVEPLTPREVTLLGLLPTHLSYAQLGDRLYLSVNTIKSNLKSIYRKLAVTSRAEAVDAAIELGLIEAGASPAGARSSPGR